VKGVEIMISLAELKNLSEMKVEDVTEPVDITTVKIDPSLDKEERIEDYIQQIKNPYIFKVNGMTVKISFSGKRKLEECIRDSLFGQE
jgi:hypothetical protein